MWHKSKPLFSDSVNTGRNITKRHRPIFWAAHGITKKPSDVNDVSNSKITENVKVPKIEFTENEKLSFLKNTKTIKSKSGKVEENKWMFIFMKRSRQI